MCAFGTIYISSPCNNAEIIHHSFIHYSLKKIEKISKKGLTRAKNSCIIRHIKGNGVFKF